MAEPIASPPSPIASPRPPVVAIVVALVQFVVIDWAALVNVSLAARLAPFVQGGPSPAWVTWMPPATLILVASLLVVVLLLLARANARAVAAYLVACLVGLPFWGMDAVFALVRAQRYPKSSARSLAFDVALIVLSVGEYLYLRRLAKRGALR